MKIRSIYFFMILIPALFYVALSRGEIIPFDFQQLELKDCLLPENHPLQKVLSRLFQDPKMFDSQQDFRDAGFTVIKRMHYDLMVARHSSLKNYMFKKFKNNISNNDQIKNFVKRVNGARVLKKFIKVNNFQHIVIPQKWIYRLPDNFSDKKTNEPSYILLVERIDICGGGKNPNGDVAKKYYHLDFDILKELCVVVYYFRGMDSTLANMPLTHQNKIAFIDTEKWALPRKKKLLRHAMDYLNEERQQYASEIFQELEAQGLRNVINNINLKPIY